MKFIIALDGRSPIFRRCEEWHTESFDGVHDGLFLDGNCVCILKAGQASFLNILKRDESHFSSIEITDDKITIQPIEAEKAGYERPTGEIDFKENKRMGMTIKEAKRVLERAGYRINGMDIDLPFEGKKRTVKRVFEDSEDTRPRTSKGTLIGMLANEVEQLAAACEYDETEFRRRYMLLCFGKHKQYYPMMWKIISNDDDEGFAIMSDILEKYDIRSPEEESFE